MTDNCASDLLTFGEHLEVLRKMLFRIITVILIFAIAIFCFKEKIFTILLAPSELDFATYRWIDNLSSHLGYDGHFDEFHVDLIATNLSCQFMVHLSTSLCIGVLCSSPYTLYELLRFVSPALHNSERKYSVSIAVVMYLLFITGVLMSYFVIFPVSFRFLGTYSVADKVHSTITLDSYISTFTTLTLMMGLVFQLPVISYIVARMGLIDAEMLCMHRKHVLIMIMLLAAIITPPDVITLILVAMPLYMLYEVSLRIIKSAH